MSLALSPLGQSRRIVTWVLTEALVHLNPTSLDRVRRAQNPAEVMRPDVGGEPVMARDHGGLHQLLDLNGSGLWGRRGSWV